MAITDDSTAIDPQAPLNHLDETTASIIAECPKTKMDEGCEGVGCQAVNVCMYTSRGTYRERAS